MNQLALDHQPTEPSYRLIPLTKGQFAKVDEEDYERVMEFKWHAAFQPKKNIFRAQRAIPKKYGEKQVFQPMPNFILNQPRGVIIDHSQHDSLDNRKRFLRVATHEQNNANRRRSRNNTSGFKGVSFSKDVKKWRASITCNKKYISLGFYSTPERAYEAYTTAARELHGEFAQT